MYHISLICSSIDKHLDWSHILDLMNNTWMNKGMQTSLQHTDFYSFQCIPGSELSGSLDTSTLSFLRNLHTILHNGYTNLHSHTSLPTLCLSSQPHWYRVVLVIQFCGIFWSQVMWYLQLCSICPRLLWLFNLSWVHTNFKAFSISVGNVIGILIGVALNQ
jgi:hypothetical protein